MPENSTAVGARIASALERATRGLYCIVWWETLPLLGRFGHDGRESRANASINYLVYDTLDTTRGASKPQTPATRIKLSRGSLLGVDFYHNFDNMPV